MTVPFSGESVAWRTEGFQHWLGVPGQMVLLPTPLVDGFTAPSSAAPVEHGLLGGGSSVTRFDSPTRRWTLSWPTLAGRDWQVVNAFDRRLFGADPWAYLNPEDVNRLTLAQSLCGGLHGTVEGWTASGTVATNTATPYLVPGGVMQWSPSAVNALLTANDGSATVPSAFACPYVPSLAWTFTVWARTVSGSTSLTGQLSSRKADGTLGSTVSGSATGITTAWTKVSVSAAVNALGTTSAAQFVLADLKAASTTAVLLCCPMLTESAVTDWAVGTGVPRVVLPSSLNRTPGVQMTSSVSMTLAEAFPGAA